MMRFVLKVNTRTLVLVALSAAGLIAVTNFGATVESRSVLPVHAMPLAAPLVTLDVDRTDDTAVAVACTPAPNDCSLRGAIITANLVAGTTINVPAGTYQLTITGAGEQFAATGDLDVRASGTSIVGAGAATTIIQQTTTDRVFETNPVPQQSGFNFSISGVTIKDGVTTGSGGAILGGGPGAVTNITNCIFDNNRVTGTLASNGGALSFTSANTGNLTITGSTFTNNKTATGVGGAIRFSTTGTLSVTTTSFSGNEATTNSGGAINVTAPGSGTYNISQSSFVNNKALGGSSRGGAIALANGVLSVSYSRLVGNQSGSGNGQAVTGPGTPGTETVNANWWGQNSGPATGSPNDVFGATPTYWLQLEHTANPATICGNGSSTLTADILALSSGGTTPASNLTGLPPFPATFTNATPALGSVSGASANFVDGIATATFTAGATGGTANIDATADAQTTTASVVIGGATTTSDPADQTVCAGVNAGFSTTAGGTGPFHYAWTLDGSPFNGDSSSITVPTGSLSAGAHTVEVTTTGTCGSASQTATLTVESPTTTTDPADQTVCKGAPATFSTTAGGTGPFHYAWTLDGNPFNGDSSSITVPTGSLSAGAHSVSVTTTGSCGSASQTATLTVHNDPPVITVATPLISLWPPNHHYHNFTLADFGVTASSSCDGNLTNSVVIVSVTSDELEDNPAGADGGTLNDIVIANDCKSVQLRAERDGDLNGRVYTVTFAVTDSAGNTTTATAHVTVPLNQNGGASVDDGPHYTVNGNCP